MGGSVRNPPHNLHDGGELLMMEFVAFPWNVLLARSIAIVAMKTDSLGRPDEVLALRGLPSPFIPLRF